MRSSTTRPSHIYLPVFIVVSLIIISATSIATAQSTTTTTTNITTMTATSTTTKTVEVKHSTTVFAVTTTVTSTTVALPTSYPTALSLSSVAPALPASGATYPAVVVSVLDSHGDPSQVPADVIVTLTSSNPAVGALSQTVRIPAGQGYAVANLTASGVPGVTEVTANAPGLSSASIQLATVHPSGIGVQLGLFALPSAITAGSHSPVLLEVELLDANGNPAPAQGDLGVTLTGLSTSGATLWTSNLVVTSGRAMGVFAYSPGSSFGLVNVVATSSGIGSASTTINVIPELFSLQLVAEPSAMATGTSGNLVASLTDANGEAVEAPYDLTISLTSSDGTVISVPSAVTIKQGEQYASVTMTAGILPGSATVTGAGQGLNPITIKVSTSNPINPPGGVVLSVGPNPALANGQSSSTIMVSLVDSGGSPALATVATTVQLSASNLLVGSVSPSVTINPGQSSAVAGFSSTTQGGSTVITATSQNLTSASMVLTLSGTQTMSLQLTSGPGVLPADGLTHPAFALTLLDSSGNPTPAPIGIHFVVTSSNGNVASVGGSAEIAAGSMFTPVNVTSSSTPGNSTIAVSSPAFGTTVVTLRTAVLSAPHLALLVLPDNSPFSFTGNQGLMVAELQDSAGNPVPAAQSLPISINSTCPPSISICGTVYPVGQLQLAAGANMVFAAIRASHNGSVALTATAPGFVPVSTSFGVLPAPVKTQISLSNANIYANENATVTINVLYLGVPLTGVSVALSVSPPGAANLCLTPNQCSSSINTATGPRGQVSFKFAPTGSSIGPATVSINLASTIFASEALSSTIQIASPPPAPPPSFIQAHIVEIAAALLAVGVVILVFSFWLYTRRRSRIRALLGEK